MSETLNKPVKKLITKINTNQNIRIWYSRQTSEVLNMYLYIVNLIFKSKIKNNINIIDVS